MEDMCLVTRCRHAGATTTGHAIKVEVRRGLLPLERAVAGPAGQESGSGTNLEGSLARRRSPRTSTCGQSAVREGVLFIGTSSVDIMLVCRPRL